MQAITNQIVDYINTQANSDQYRQFICQLAEKLINVDNVATKDLDKTGENERGVLSIVEESCREVLGSDCQIQRQPIRSDIAQHPYYTMPFYAIGSDGQADQQVPDVEEIYRNRYNLVVTVRPDGPVLPGRGVIYNAHVDTVGPFFGFRIDQNYIYGRGACDDKGLVAMLIAHMKLIKEVQEKFQIDLATECVYQFVIEEEMGGNGSLSLSLDQRFHGYEVIVLESTNNVPHPANRGAMWFRLNCPGAEKINTANLIGFVIMELALEGQKIRAESNLPLFPKEYVQLNFGSLGHYGQTPSSVNDYVAFDISLDAQEKIGGTIGRLVAVFEAAIRRYCMTYPDRTAPSDQAAGVQRLDRHYRLTPGGQSGRANFKLEVFGIGGHMSEFSKLDNAVIKAGYLLEALHYAAVNYPGWGVSIQLADSDKNAKSTGTAGNSIASGGVGFTPAHRMVDLQHRLREAVRRALRRYRRCTGVEIADDVLQMNFDMLHNEAYSSLVDCPVMKAFECAYRQLGLSLDELIAFGASSDGRIFANSGHNTVTFGPGHLADAHSDREKLDIGGAQRGLAILALTSLALDSSESMEEMFDLEE